MGAELTVRFCIVSYLHVKRLIDQGKKICVGSAFVQNVDPRGSSGPSENRDALYKVLCKYRGRAYVLKRLNTKERDTDIHKT